MRVMIQLRSSAAAQEAARTPAAALAFTSAVGTGIPGLVLDSTFGAVQVPTPIAPAGGAPTFAFTGEVAFSSDPADSTYIVRGSLPDDQTAFGVALANPAVIGVFADPVIESTLICPGAGPMGTDAMVASQLKVPALATRGLTGKGVYLAIVDTGINRPHLVAHGKAAAIDAARSWTPAGVPTAPGAHPVNHGTMCAYDALISAPQSTMLDHAVLLSKTPGATVMAGLLSDAVKSYSKLLGILTAVPRAKRAMVVSNSWGMFNPAWDYPIGHPGNYSDNPAHPFNVIVKSLEAAGADILFAAGNCGRDCPDGRCAFGATRPICGANSHPAVLSVAGVDISKKRVGYSSQGPGRLSTRKPDISAYTHFKGSGVYAADGGTSAACPVAAGVLAALRTKYPLGKGCGSRSEQLRRFRHGRLRGATGIDARCCK